LSSRLVSKNVRIRIYRTVILALFLYKTLSLTLREEHRLRVFENIELTRMLSLKRDEVTGGWRKLHNEDLVVFSKSRWVRLAGHVARMGGKRGNACRLLVGKPEGKHH
jgi:hypothetical protein